MKPTGVIHQVMHTDTLVGQGQSRVTSDSADVRHAVFNDSLAASYLTVDGRVQHRPELRRRPSAMGDRPMRRRATPHGIGDVHLEMPPRTSQDYRIKWSPE